MARKYARVRVQKKPFDCSSAPPQTARAPDPAPCKELYFTPNQFLAVRNDSDGFYLCKALQYVYSTTGKFMVQWLEVDAKDDSTYRQSHIDKIEANSILTNVQLRRVDRNIYSLPPKQQIIINKRLMKSIAGNDDDSDEDDDDDDDDDNEHPDEEEPARKKSRKTAKVRQKSSLKTGAKQKLNLLGSKQKVKKAKGLSVKKVVEKKVKSESGGKRKSAPVLVPRPNIKILERDPFMETREKVPFISATPNSKLVLRAVNLDDTKLLAQLINDVSTISSVHVIHSVGYYVDPLQLAFLHDNANCVKVLCSEISKPKPKRIAPTSGILGHQTTGRYNKFSLGGVPTIRKLALSRGSREGNNAFTKDLAHAQGGKTSNKYIDFAMRSGVSKKTLETYIAASSNASLRSQVYDKIYLAVRYGHRKLAGELMEEQAKAGQTFFNFLHKDVLLFENEDLRAGIRAISVKKKPWDNCKITPLHCAAINPNPKYLAALLKILPESGIVDANLRRPIHYAAACEGPGPLKFLLNRGMDPDDADNTGMTVLHIACDAGRTHNVEVLLAKANTGSKSQDESASVADGKSQSDTVPAVASADDEELCADDQVSQKYGIGGINRPIDKGHNKYHSYCPLHLATNKGFYDVVEMLLKYGAVVDCELGASKNKLTPLMIACSIGRLDLVRLLLKHGAKPMQKDKIGRTPLTHAAMNGQAHVMSLLLNIGVEIDQQDTSGNAPLHYAVGYGWYFCAKMLLDAGANPSIANDWKTTPTAVAFLKGHVGLTDLLLEQPSVDINFRLDSGMTLLSLACSSSLIEGIVEQIEYLIVDKKADCTLTDANNSNALHHLANNNISNSGQHNASALRLQAMQSSLVIAKLLVKHGCQLEATNNEGMTPVMYAVQQGNTVLMKYLVETGCGVSTAVDKNNRNILHLFAEQCMQQPMAGLLSTVHKNISDPSLLVEIAKQVDHYGFTPLLRACMVYRAWNGDVSDHVTSDGDLEKKKESRRSAGVNFIEGLIKLCSANPADKIQKKHFDKVNAMPKEEIMCYHSADVAGYNTVHLLVTVGHEALHGISALSRVLKNLPANSEAVNDAEFQGRTPLILGAINRSQRNNILSLLEFGVDVNTKSLNKETDGYSTALVLAARCGHHSIIEDLLNFGADATEVDQKNSCTALHYVMQSAGLVPLVTALIASKADVNARDKDLNTPLHYLVEKNHLGVCSQTLSAGNVLIKAGANVNACNSKKRTPLHLAVNRNVGGANSSTAMEQLLLDNGADIMAVDCRGRLPLHYVFVKIGHHKDTSAIDPVELCSTLLSAVDSPRKMVVHADNFQQTPLHLASQRGAGVCCMYLIKNGGDVNCPDINGNTSLSLAVLYGHESCTLLLIQQRADVSANIFIVPEPEPEETKADTKKSKVKSSDNDNEAEDEDDEDQHEEDEEDADQDEEGEEAKNQDEEDEEDEEDEDQDEEDEDEYSDFEEYKPLEKKVKKKPLWFWDPLRKRKKTQEITSYSVFQGVVAKEWQGIMFLMIDVIDLFSVSITTVVKAAFVTNKYNLAKMLIRKMKGDSEVIFDHGQNLAHILAKTCESNSNAELLTQVAQELFDKGVSFQSLDKYGCTPLHYACLQCNIPLVNFILDSCKYPSNIISSMLNMEDTQGRTPMAAVFWKLSQHGQTVLSLAKLLHQRQCTFDVLCPYPVDYKCLYGQQLTNRESACSTDYNSPSSSTRTSPLILAIVQEQFTVVQQLLESGASLNFTDCEGRTPLMVAVDQNNVDIVRLLLDHSYKIDNNNDSDSESGSDMEDQRSTYVQFKKQSLFTVGRPTKGKSLPDNAVLNRKKTKHYVNGVNMACTTFKKKSDVDLKAINNHRRSVLHFLIKPLPHGCFDNHKLLIQLEAAGVPLNQYREVCEMALNRGLVRLSTAYQFLVDKKCSNFKQPTISMSTVDDGISWKWPAPDFKTDAVKFLSKFEDDSAMDDGSTGFIVQPDSSLSGSAETWEVMTDPARIKFCDIMLFKIDVRAGSYGLYNFYKMQVVHQKGKDLYILFTRWGRIGDVGQFQQTPFPQLSDAIVEFKKIFRSKTGNDWSKLDQQPFEHKPGKYRLVPEEERYFGKQVKDIKLFLPKSSHHSKLHLYVQDMMAELTDVTAYSSTLKKLGVDQSIFPLGRINKQRLVDAKNILTKLQTLVQSVEKLRAAMPNTDMQKYSDELVEISHLSNEFYHLVPRSGFQFESVRILDNASVLETEWKNIQTLLEMEVATKIMAGALYCSKEINPLDYVYRCLGCKIQLMDEMDTDAQYILRYISATFTGSVEAVYQVARDGENKRLMNCGVKTNHKLLFHGSSSSNLISILSRGLLIAPPEAPVSGYRYGKGIYSADKFSKSAGYCYNNSRDSNIKFMLVCQVALGKSKYLVNDTVDKAPPGYDSVIAQAVQYPDPKYDLTLPTGAVIPLGSCKAKKTSWVTVNGCRRYYYNTDREYIVYKEDQVALRYLIQFKS